MERKEEIDQSLSALFGETYTNRWQHEKDIILDWILREEERKRQQWIEEGLAIARKNWDKVSKQWEFIVDCICLLDKVGCNVPLLGHKNL